MTAALVSVLSRALRRHWRTLALRAAPILFALAACAGRQDTPDEAISRPSKAIAETGRVQRPWWHGIKAGVFRRDTKPAVMAVGRSAEHRHPAEGLIQAKVRARLAVRRAAGAIAFVGPLPEPYIEDMFIGPDGTFWALYRLDVPSNAKWPASVTAWTPPARVRQLGRRRIGRHMFEDTHHLYLECDVEGPLTNPDWGQNRASAALLPSRTP
ncbi:MAG: hypothetical protein AAFV29_17185 [Myxococcota bacterium]